MFDVEITINGRPATEANIKDELEKATLEAMIDGLKETITSTITPQEARQISIDLVSAKLGDVSFKISGPDEIVRKVETALGS